MVDPLMPAVEFFLAIFYNLPYSIQTFIYLILALFGIALFWNILYHIRS